MKPGRRVSRATIEDVAAAAGVSVATVSRALRGMSNVAPHTRDRVFAVADQLKYRADPHASRLARGRTNTVAMAVPALSGWYFSRVVAGAERVLSGEGYDLLLYGVSSAEEREGRISGGVPLHERADGLILVDLRLPVDDLRHLAGTGGQVVTIGFTTGYFPAVKIDNVEAARRATRHLIESGHTDLGLVSGVPDVLEFTVPEDRRTGFLSALDDAGITYHPEWDVPGDFTIDGGRRAFEQLLAADERPTAVFVQSDEMAFGAMQAAREHGVRIPEDLSLIGFDDHDVSAAVGLTTIRQPIVAQGAAAARALLDRIDGREGDGTVISFPTELVTRSTVAPPAR
ncbi:MAG: LacI family DNA-binding transcriptional regulator [Actinomycetota bacterium]|nr:LacI family DNA-binding transcriptional regulator [Actinomycetota bacterium]